MNAAPVGSREIANQGLVNLSSESLAIVEQLSSTVPALQTPTQASAAFAEHVEDSQTANAAPEQLGQLFYNGLVVLIGLCPISDNRNAPFDLVSVDV